MRTMFYISDRTAITAETIGHSLLAQFEGAVEYREVTIPYVDSPEKAREAVKRIQRTLLEDGEVPLVFSTIAEPASRDVIIHSEAFVLDLFHAFLEPLQQALHTDPASAICRSTKPGLAPSTSASSTMTVPGSRTTTRRTSS
jgi:regulator of PEP synthase PpsR (kinase-PPPase family)